VFWQDYYAWGLGKAGEHNSIAALVRGHEDHAGGATTVLHVDDDLYIMKREGIGAQNGLIFVMNNRGVAWNGAWVWTQWNDTHFVLLHGTAAVMRAFRRSSRPRGTEVESFPRRR